MADGDHTPTEASDGEDDLPRVARVAQLRLVFSPASGAGAVLTLGDEPVVLGREPEGARTIRLDDSQASRNHARVERASAGWRLVDLGSRNGIHADGAKVAAAPLSDGTVIRIGRSLLVFVETAIPVGVRLEPETPGLAGQSIAMQRVRGELATVAPADLPVLILGETGVGKERAAQELHRLSGRKGAFIPVNCAAIPEPLAESELFGHAPGAFTGAVQRSEGLFVAAEGGTLFLDEIGELPAAIQPKLLRALGSREIRPVGKSEPRTVNVRVIAATLRALEAPAFREDLFARLAGWTVRILPLRQRRDDILRLAQTFLARGGDGVALSTGAAESLLLHDWPHNVRQLEQVVSAAAVRAVEDRVIRTRHLPAELTRRLEDAEGASAEPPLEIVVPRDAVPSETDLRLVVERLGGNLARVAEYFGKDRRQVYRWLERFAIDVSGYRDVDD